MLHHEAEQRRWGAEQREQPPGFWVSAGGRTRVYYCPPLISFAPYPSRYPLTSPAPTSRLATVYNVLGSNGMAKYSTFLAMINFAAAGGKDVLAAVTPECEGLEGKLAEWGTDVTKARALYTAIFTAMDQHKDR